MTVPSVFEARGHPGLFGSNQDGLNVTHPSSENSGSVGERLYPGADVAVASRQQGENCKGVGVPA